MGMMQQMFATFQTTTGAPGSTTDSLFQYVSLLLNGEPTTSITTSAISDAGPNNLLLTPTATTQLRIDPFSPYQGTGNYSINCTGGAQYLTITNTTVWQFGTGDFTVEGWFNFINTGASNLINSNTVNSFALYTTGTAIIAGHATTTNTTPTTDITAAFTPIVGLWYHIAVTRASNTERLFINGTQVGTATVATSMPATGSNYIGYQSGVGYASCYMSNIRTVKGTAVYTSNFTVPTAPLTAISGTSLLTCQDGYIKDNSGNNYAITNTGSIGTASTNPFVTTPNLLTGSAWFNGGTGGDQYISTVSHPGFALGTGAFTVEFWSYMQVAGTSVWFSGAANGVSTATNSRISAFGVTSSNGVWPSNVWTHICVQRSAGTVYLYANGVLVGSGANVAVYPQTTDSVSIGGWSSGSSSIMGNISNVRVVVGSIVYATGGFTAPTSPLTAVPGTTLLTLQNSIPFNNKTFVDSSSNDIAITPTGTPIQGTFTPFSQTGWSGYFGGVSDYVSVADAAPLQLPSGDFTIEFWFNAQSTASGAMLTKWSATNTGYYIGFATANTLGFYSTAVGAGVTYPFSTTGVWTHVAAVRYGTSYNLYVNGTLVASATSATAMSDSATALNIGRNSGNSTNYYAGYISNVRIVKGTAIYTTNFTPSTAPLTAITNTSLLTLQSNRFKDNSTNNFALTATGTPSIQAVSPFEPAAPYTASVNGGSIYLSGSTDSLTASSAGFAFGANDFTMEAWVYKTSFPGVVCGIMSTDNGGTGSVWGSSLAFDSTGKPTFLVGNDPGRSIITSATILPLNQWFHIAGVQRSQTLYLYVNGVQVGTVASGIRTPNTTSIGVGQYYAGASANWTFPGYLSSVRVVNGTAVYTGAFTPPTTPLAPITGTQLLLSATPTGAIDASGKSNLTTVGTAEVTHNNAYAAVTIAAPYSVAFAGTTNGVTSASINPASGSAFTIEMWVKAASYTATGYWMIENSGWLIGNLFSGNIGITFQGNAGGGATYFAWTAAILPINVWNHIAFVRENTGAGGLKIYVNGALIAIGANNAFAGADVFTLGGGGGTTFAGSISNFRIVDGIAVYTAPFRPPVAPLTAIAGTTLLLFNTSALLKDSSVNNYTFTAIGTAQTPTLAGPTTGYVTASSSKFGTGGMYFNGTSDSITGKTQPIGTGNFTIECWVNFNSVSTDQCIYAITNGSTTTQVMLMLTGATSKPRFLLGNDDGTTTIFDMTSSTTVVANAWYYIAAVVSGTNANLYINGSNVAIASSATARISTLTTLAIGWLNSTAPRYLNGYLDDLRITTGIARYTGGFTVPTSAFPDNSLGDPYFNSVSLLMHADGTVYTSPANNNNTIIDSSYNAFTITKTGAPIQGTFSPFDNNGWGAFYNNASYSNVSNNTALDLGAGNFTVEFWLYVPGAWASLGAGAVMGKKLDDTTNGWQIYRNGSQANLMAARLSLTNDFFTGSTPANSVWQHWALVRNGSTVTWYKNGVVDATGTNSSNITDPDSLKIGYANTWGVYGQFYMSNLRIVKGTAVYTSAFTPTTVQLPAITGTSLLTLQNGRFVDNSVNAFAITTGAGAPAINFGGPVTTGVSYSSTINGRSIYLNGTTDYVSAAGSVTIPGDFTVEAWVYDKGTTTYATALGCRTTGTWQGFYLQRSNGSANIIAAVGSAGTTAYSITQSSGTYTTNVWHHIALVRSGSTATVYVDGLSVGTGALAGTITAGANFKIGTDPQNITGITYFSGYVSNARLVNGTALYKANFIPPTAPLAITGNTALLLNAAGSGIIDGTGKINLTTVSTATTSTTQVKFGTGSMYFDGSGYLTAPNTGFANFGTGNFTVEWQQYFTGAWTSSNGAGIGQKLNDASTGWIIYRNTASNINSYSFRTVATDYASTVTPTANVWEHWAIVRNGTTLTWYCNGTACGTFTGVSANITDSTGLLTVGWAQRWATAFVGYIDDLRITNGIARYTSNFTAPTAALPNNGTTDPYFQYNALLLQGDIQSVTQNVSKNNLFLDSSLNTSVITPTGTPIQGTFSPFDQNGWSGYFNGTTDYLALPANAAFVLGTADFTIEAWVYVTALTVAGVYSTGGNATVTTNTFAAIIMGSDLKPQVYLGTSATGTGVISANPVSANTWVHLAAARLSGTTTLYVNGVNSASTSVVYNLTSAAAPTIGRLYTDAANAHFFAGYISNLRVVKGTAVYTSNFTVPTSPLSAITNTALLTLQNNRFVDNSANNFALTATGTPSIQAATPFAVSSSYSTSTNSGSMLFNGSTDYLSTPVSASSTLNISAGNDCTVEAWVYPLSFTGPSQACAIIASNSDAFEIVATPTTGNSTTIRLFTNGGSGAASWAGPDLIYLNSWNHVAVTRTGGLWSTYVNGVLSVQSATNTILNTYPTMQVGLCNRGTATFWNGYISNARVVNGTAVYTGSSFALPTAPLTAISGTALLLNGTNGGIIDNVGGSDLMLVGSAQVGSNSKFGNGALALNGSTDYAYVPGTNPNFAFGTGDYTVEFWFNAGATGTQYGLYDSRPAGTATYAGLTLWKTTTQTIQVYVNATIQIASTTALAANTWNFVAVSRVSGVTRLFVNGIQEGSPWTDATTYVNGVNRPALGVDANTANGSFFNGSIDDLRITKGVGRYVSSFAVPTGPFPTN
jgi:hypothetical protein